VIEGQLEVVLHESLKQIGHPLPAPSRFRRLRQLIVDPARTLRDVVPVEAQHVLGCLRHEPVAKPVVDQEAFDHDAEMLGVAAVEPQPNALAYRHDLAKAAGVGDDARTT